MYSDRFYGVGEPLVLRDEELGVPAEACLDLIKAMGCNSYRSWMHLTDILENPTTPKREAVEAHHRFLVRAKELDIEVTGMSHEWFLPEGCRQRTGHAIPARDLAPDSLYMKTLEMLEESWATQAALFPEITIWEVGNEWNLNAFLHPDGFLESDMSHPFTADEKMDIAVDLMYFSAKGVRRGNPNAKVTSFSPNLCIESQGMDMPHYLPVMYGIAWTLEKIYSRIKSGKFWSADTDDYFDMVAWHPYLFALERPQNDRDLFLNVSEPDQLWWSYNDAAYQVMCKYGDGHKKVILSETGFTDCGDPDTEARYGEYNKKMLEIAATLPYVHTVHNFRLFNDASMLNKAGIEQNQIGGVTEAYFGLFTEPKDGCQPRKRALAIQELTGSKEDLYAVGRKVAEMRL